MNTDTNILNTLGSILIEWELDLTKKQMQELRKRINFLEKYISHPSVDVVGHFWRYGVKDYSIFDTVQEAAKCLRIGEDYGEHSAVGISIGDYMLTDEEIKELGGDDW